MSNDLNLQLRITASATDAINAFGELRRSLNTLSAQVTEAQNRTAQLAREFRTAQQHTEALRVQYALGQRALQDLGESAGRTSPQYRALAAELRQLHGDLRQSEHSTQQTERAFDAARQSTARLQTQMETMRESVHRSRQALQAQGLDVGHLATEYTRLQREIRQAEAEQTRQQRLGQARETLGITPHSEIQGRINAVQTALRDLRQSGELTFAEMAQAELHAATMADELRGNLNGVGHTFAQLQGDLLEFGAALAMVYGTIDQAAKFESGFAGVAKVVDASTGELSALSDELLKMTRTLPIASTDLLAIAEAAGSLGIAAGDVSEFTEGVAKMAFAFKIPAEQAADMAAGIKNAFALSVKQTFALGDAINTLGNQFAATENDILNVDSRIAATANTFGLSAEQASGFATTLLSLKTPPEVAGSAINGLLSRLQSARVQSKDFQDALKAIGTDANQLAADIAANPQQAIDNFLKKLSQLDKTSLAEVSAKLIGTGSDASALQALAQHLDLYQKAVKTATDTTKTAGSAQQEFDTGMKTTSAQVLIAKNALMELAVRIGTTLLPMVNGAASALAQLAQSLADLAKDNPVFTRLLTVLTPLLVGANALRAAFAALGVAFAPLVAAFSAGGAASTALAAGLSGVGTLLLRLIGGQIGLAILALTQLADAWDKNKAKSLQFGDSQATLAEIVSAVWGIITKAYQAGADKIAAAIEFLRVFLGDNLRQMGNDLLAAIQPFKTLANSIIGVFNGLGQAVGVSLAIFVETISTKFRHAVALAQAAGRDIRAAFSGDFSVTNTTAQLQANAQDNQAQAQRLGTSPRRDAFLSGYTASTKGDAVGTLAGRLVDDFNRGASAAIQTVTQTINKEINLQRNKKGIPDGVSEGTQDQQNKANHPQPTGGKTIDWDSLGGGGKGGSGKKSASSGTAKTPKPPEESEMHGFEAGLEQQKIAFERQNALLDYSKAQEKAYWDGIIASYHGNSKTLADLKRKSADAELAMIRQKAKEQVALQNEADQAAHDAALSELDAKTAASEQELALGNITQAEHLANLRQFATERLQIELDLLEAKRKLLGDDKLALAQNLHAKEALIRSYNAIQKGLDSQEAQDKKVAFKNLFAPFETAMDGMVQGVLSGQQTISNAVKNAAASMVTSYAAAFVKKRLQQSAEWVWEVSGFAGKEAKKKAIENAGEAWDTILWTKKKIKLGAEWLWETLGFAKKETTKTLVKATSETTQAGITATAETAKAGAVVVGEAAQTGAVATGTAARKTIETTAHAESGIKQAWRAAKGAFASVMDMVPFPLNVVLAPVAAIGAFAGVMALGSSKGGEYYVDGDDKPYLLHKNETVLPSGVADNFRTVVEIVKHTVAHGERFSPEPIEVNPVEGKPVEVNPIDIIRTLRETGQLKPIGLPDTAIRFTGNAQTAATQLAKDRLHADNERQSIINNKTEAPTIHLNGIMLSPEDFLEKHGKTIVKVAQKQARNFNTGKKP